MIPHLPRSTLFPYTTLFRSQLVRDDPVANPGSEHVRRSDLSVGRCCRPLLELGPRTSGCRLCWHLRFRRAQRSEEHTSNSSHSQISYAVFCLKKKIKPYEPH